MVVGIKNKPKTRRYRTEGRAEGSRAHRIPSSRKPSMNAIQQQALEQAGAFDNFEKGLEAEEEGDLKNAIKFLKRNIFSGFAEVEAALALGEIYSKRNGMHELAVEFYQIATEIDPNSAEAFHGLAYAQKQLGERRAAERNYKEAIRLRPGFAESHFNLAALYNSSPKRKMSALPHWQAYVRFGEDPENHRTRLSLLTRCTAMVCGVFLAT